MSEKVLLVDDDQSILDGYCRVLRGSFDLVTCNGASEGLEAIAKHGPFAVVVSDYRMPEMDGVQFLSWVRQVAPNTVRIMLTGHADLQMAVDAINAGNIYHFLTKPCSSELLAKTLEHGIEHFRLITSERKLQNRNLRKAVRLLIDVLSNAPIGIAILHHGLIIFVNEAFLYLFEFRGASELYNRPLGECIAADCRYEFTERLIELGKSAPVPRLLETTGLKKNGNAFPIFVEFATINVSDRSASVIFFRDINDRTPTEEKLSRPEITGGSLTKSASAFSPHKKTRGKTDHEQKSAVSG